MSHELHSPLVQEADDHQDAGQPEDRELHVALCSDEQKMKLSKVKKQELKSHIPPKSSGTRPRRGLRTARWLDSSDDPPVPDVWQPAAGFSFKTKFHGALGLLSGGGG